jgi:hypothetical protein
VAAIQGKVQGVTQRKWFKRHPWRTGVLVIVCAAVAYFVYLCSPHGYRRLEQLESRLDQLTPQEARIEKSAGPLLSVGSQVKIAANPGERIISSSYQTGAWRFPCAEELSIILVFDGQDKLSRRYIGRFPICL